MKFSWCRLFLLYLICLVQPSIAQETSLRTLELSQVPDSLLLDSLLVYPNSLEIRCGTTLLGIENYTYNPSSGTLFFLQPCSDTLRIVYRVLPMAREMVYQRRDTSSIYTVQKGDRDKFLFTSLPTNSEIFGGNSLNKSGSISRGITFGNNQNLGINSSLNLQLSGDIAPNLKLLAVVSDDNLPIQAEGNTNQLREFDQVFIQVYNDRMKLIAGDFWLRKPKGYFMSYQKRAQGLSFENRWQLDSNRVWKTQLSGALSRGKFNRQIVPGIEGNQGPYRLTGADNEPFIIVLSGTEQVFIDGRLLERGQEFDYTIDYNTAELIFTSRNQITKDSRIVVEFQYSDQNFARSLIQNSTTYESEKLDFWFNTYSEQDAKNQSLQQDLSFDQKKLLANIGDSLFLARSSSIDSIGFQENQVVYALRDSLGYDSVLVASVHPDSAIYRATFLYVGPNKGNYVFETFNALGKVYRWVVPVGGIPQGDYTPSRLLAAPKKQQMVSSGVRYRLSSKWTLENEVALSVNDINTFSRLDSGDDKGYANKFSLRNKQKIGAQVRGMRLESKAELEYLQATFRPIQQYRAVEFDRDWNTRNRGYLGQQVYSTVGTKWIKDSLGFATIEGQQFSIGDDFEGYKTQSEGNIARKGFRANWIGSYLSSRSDTKNQFLRHKADISQGLGKIRIGYKDDHERNTYNGKGFPLARNSYQFFDYQFYLSNQDSANNSYRVFYRERYDLLSDSTRLSKAAKAKTVGGEIGLKKLKNQNLNIVTSYRELAILDTLLINQSPEKTLLGRIDYELRALKGALTLNNFYEAGSGLELKREFLYIKVNDGQGIYTWIDYNQDGVKDLNEFEVAQFVDQASYIRVFTPSNTYVKTFSNELNQSVIWRPERLWASKKGLLKQLARFSNQTRYRIVKKTTGLKGFDAFNPVSATVRDTHLISTSSSFRNTVYFNRTSSIFNLEYNYQDIQSKSLLASGFDGRLQRYHEIAPRWNIARIFSIETAYQVGQKLVDADYTTGRNYSIRYFFVEPSFSFQPSTKFRVSLEGKYTEKRNATGLGGQNAFLGQLGSDIKYNQAEKGSFQANVKMIQINYKGDPNSALGFEMLEGLKAGRNYTWTAGYQRSLSNNLQISIQYNGRKSENNKTIHSGGMEVRAFF